MQDSVVAAYILAASLSVPAVDLHELIVSGFREENNGWRELEFFPFLARPASSLQLTETEIQVVAPQFNDLQIGELTLRVQVP